MEACAAEAGKYQKDRPLLRRRARAALDAMLKLSAADSGKVAAIGYCFGGTTALVLAASGAPLKAVSTFHAGLPPLTADQAKNIHARLLINNGADDSFVSREQIDAFRKALDGAGVKYEFENYPGAVHSFTVKGAEKHEIKGMAYNEAADKKSWELTTALFKETLGK
jgi:dienelactone hydrolase